MHFDNPIFIFIVIVAALLRWLAKRASERGEDPTRPVIPNDPVRRHKDGDTEEERIRQFLEALGQPAGSKPPPKTAPKRPRPSPRPIIVAPVMPPLTTIPPPEAPITVFTAEEMPPPLPVEQRVFLPRPTQEPAFEVGDVTAQAPTSPPLQLPVRRPAASRDRFPYKFDTVQDLRNAIILREILGPPRSLQPVDLL